MLFFPVNIDQAIHYMCVEARKKYPASFVFHNYSKSLSGLLKTFIKHKILFSEESRVILKSFNWNNYLLKKACFEDTWSIIMSTF